MRWQIASNNISDIIHGIQEYPLPLIPHFLKKRLIWWKIVDYFVVYWLYQRHLRSFLQHYLRSKNILHHATMVTYTLGKFIGVFTLKKLPTAVSTFFLSECHRYLRKKLIIKWESTHTSRLSSLKSHASCIVCIIGFVFSNWPWYLINILPMFLVNPVLSSIV